MWVSCGLLWFVVVCLGMMEARKAWLERHVNIRSFTSVTSVHSIYICSFHLHLFIYRHVKICQFKGMSVRFVPT